MTPDVLIIGNGKSAAETARVLAASGVSVGLVASTAKKALPDSLHALPDTGKDIALFEKARIRLCRPTEKGFTVYLSTDTGAISLEVRHILIAEETTRRVQASCYGLQEGPFVIGLSDFKSRLEVLSGDPALLGTARHVAFLCGIFHESLPLISEEVMEAASALQRNTGAQAHVFTGNLKVAGKGLEALYRKAKEAGVLFIKFTEHAPQIVQSRDGRVTLTYRDEILRRSCMLEPDLVVVDETLHPAPNLGALAEIFHLETGPDGFLQADNVHRLPTATNRKGIGVVGPARGVSDGRLLHAETAHAALAVSVEKNRASALEAPAATPKGRAGQGACIEKSRCVRCLTCFRVCPYRAVALAPRPVILPRACEGCGICVAECPGNAIDLPGYAPLNPDMASESRPMEPEESGASSRALPPVTVFCCRRSAVAARDMARAMGAELPPKTTFIEVPCAGAVSQVQVLEAFRGGAHGVLVVGCHRDNCHSDRGTRLAQRRLAHTARRLGALGFSEKQLAYGTVAANMGAEFGQILRDFAGTLNGMGRALPDARDGT